MKYQVTAKDLKIALKTLSSLYSFAAEDKSTESFGILTVKEGEGLWIEYGAAGAYIKLLVEGTVLRPGTSSVDFKSLHKCKFSGDVVLDAKDGASQMSISILTGKKVKTVYKIMTKQGDNSLIDLLRPPKKSKKPLARLPAYALRTGAASVTYKGGLSEKGEGIKIEAKFEKTKKGGKFVLSGRDKYSFSIYSQTSKQIKVVKSFNFVLTSGLIKDVVENIREEIVNIWVISSAGEASSTVRFKSKTFDFCHPVIDDADLEDLQDIVDQIESGKKLGTIDTTKVNLKSAVEDVKVFESSTNLILDVTRKRTKLLSRGGSNKASVNLDTDKIITKKSFTVGVNLNYLFEFIKAMPSTLDVRIEVWDKAIKILGQGVKKGQLGYVMALGESDD